MCVCILDVSQLITGTASTKQMHFLSCVIKIAFKSIYQLFPTLPLLYYTKYIYIYACINLSKLLILLLLLLTTYKFLFKNNTNPFINQTDLSLTTDFSSRFPDFSPQTNRNQRRGRIRIRTCFRRASHELGTSIVLQTIWNFLVQRDFDLELLSCSFGDKDRSSTFLNGKLANSFWPIFFVIYYSGLLPNCDCVLFNTFQGERVIGCDSYLFRLLTYASVLF